MCIGERRGGEGRGGEERGEIGGGGGEEEHMERARKEEGQMYYALGIQAGLLRYREC